MVLESLDGSFCEVSLVVVRGYQLVQFFCISFLNSAEASLSRMCVFGFTVPDEVSLIQNVSDMLLSLLLLIDFSLVLR